MTVPAGPQSPDDNGKRPTTPLPERRRQWWKFWEGDPDAVLAKATVLLAVATLALVVVAGIQAWILLTTDASTREAASAATRSAGAAQTAVQDAQRNFRDQQRPVIWLTNNLGGPQFILRPAGDSGQIVWLFHYTNYGRTPALRLTFRHFVTINGTRELSYGFKPTTIGVPLPTGKDDFTDAVSHPGITSEEFNKLKTTDHAIEVSGEFDYSDAYGGQFESTFCISHLANGAITYCDGNNIK